MKLKHDLLTYDDDMLPQNPCIIEVGSITGLNAIEMSREYPKSDIYVYEADPDNFKKLSDSVNGYKNIHTFNKAVCNRNGFIRLHKYSTTNSNSLYPRKKYKEVGTDKVESVSIAKVASEFKFINLLILNCEGAEIDILLKIIEDGLCGKIEQISVEFHKKIKTKKTYMEMVYALMPYYHIQENEKETFLFTHGKGISA